MLCNLDTYNVWPCSCLASFPAASFRFAPMQLVNPDEKINFASGPPPEFLMVECGVGFAGKYFESECA